MPIIYQRIAAFLFVAIFFATEPLLADTVTLKNGKNLKGLVVERHEDRVILSTADGEISVLLRGIKNIEYDDIEQNFFQMGRLYEKQGKLGEALALYEKSLEANPEFKDAQQAITGIRSRFFAEQTEGPRNEMEKQQLLQDSWSEGKSFDRASEREKPSSAKILKERLGVSLAKKGNWVIFSFVSSKGPAGLAGLRRNDRLVSIDGASLRYLDVDVVSKKMLEPRGASFTLEFERDIFIRDTDKRLKNIGVELNLQYQGVIIKKVAPESVSEKAGLLEQDLLISAQGVPTRYMPLKKVSALIENSKEDRIVLTVHRNTILSRG